MGERIFLRSPKNTDWAEFFALIRRSRQLFRGVVSPFKNEHEFAAYVERCREDDYLGLLICRIEDRAILGTINMFHIVRANFMSARIGYSIGQPFAGQGYMTEALQLVLRLAFKELDLHRIEASIQPDNEPSIALVKRAGFAREGFSPRYLKICGRWRDHEHWAIRAEEWRPLRKIKNAKPR